MAITPSFLSLPPEIRNRIYEFAFTPADGLGHVHNRASSGKKSFFYDTGCGGTYYNATLKDEFDRLKYVNHQLYSRQLVWSSSTFQSSFSTVYLHLDVLAELKWSGS
ncbi:hypothetical protein BU25DRAFT_418470 [Macroventuria anomochaeta]|uniref:Uncharacterized protein n=1 Tax=Macroventuria anomochaeta TaxID=301207 RepID=A0ACB6SEL8_9PLEO|nr:uncharacterized protein BU25DRAFT_418470 [Macroventuria anomochaeta]KAF2631704.1 hypothetical protein BU25DRAFT_418470 [Macroventuria anomochaeta]